MVAIGGEMDAGEGNGALGAIRKRQQGSRLYYYLLMTALAFVGCLSGWLVAWLGHWSDMNAVLAIVVGGWLALIVYLRFCNRWAVSRFRKKMVERGLKTRFAYSLEVSDEALTLQVSDVRSIAPWTAVTEIFRSKPYWIFLVRTNPWFAPSRFFADQAAEKAFLREALAHMTPEARARSKAAETFASS